jgi:hypothetical protein
MISALKSLYRITRDGLLLVPGSFAELATNPINLSTQSIIDLSYFNLYQKWVHMDQRLNL